ncbi:hypothetical protein H1R20_g1055, partial [Candolleomyces eurysporus]
MIVEIAQDNSISLKASANMLFDSTGDEDSERNHRVFFKEAEKVIDKFLHPSLVLALIEAVDHDDKGPLGEGLLKNVFVDNTLERSEDQPIQLCSQGHMVAGSAAAS